MKFTILLGFFATTVTVSAILSGNFNVHRIDYPQTWFNAARNCLASISKESYDSFLSYNKTTATIDAKCRALCYYSETGEFADGKFDKIAIENFLRGYIGSHQLLDKLVEFYKTAADAGNAEVGGDHEKAYAYHAALGTSENLKVIQAIFRRAW